MEETNNPVEPPAPKRQSPGWVRFLRIRQASRVALARTVHVKALERASYCPHG